MTLKETIELLKTIAQSQPNIRYVGEGNVYELNHKPDIEYGVFYITQSNTQIFDNYVQYNLNLFYVDRLTDDFDNRLQVQSDGIRVIKNILNIYEDMGDDEISYPLNFTSFNERFCDECAGVFTTVSIVTDGLSGCIFE